ncbi:MAG: hypothetical protein R3C58_14710 [Parvularculaceae bacterium]
MRFGLIASVLLHVAVIFGGVVLLPSFIRLPDVAPEPYIPLDLIREADLALKTSVPAASPKPKPVEEPKPDLPKEEEPPQRREEEQPKAKAPEPEPAPIEKKPEIVPEKKPEPKKEKPKKKTDELDLDALSQVINKEKQKEQAAPSENPSETTELADRERQQVGAGDRLTASDEAKMLAAIQECWNAAAIIGAPDPEKLIVSIDFELNRDGSLASQPRVANELQISLSGNQFWRVAQREALNAVVKCAPYDFLPQERYETWKEFRFNFDPSKMAGL